MLVSNLIFYHPQMSTWAFCWSLRVIFMYLASAYHLATSHCFFNVTAACHSATSRCFFIVFQNSAAHFCSHLFDHANILHAVSTPPTKIVGDLHLPCTLTAERAWHCWHSIAISAQFRSSHFQLAWLGSMLCLETPLAQIVLCRALTLPQPASTTTIAISSGFHGVVS